MKSHKHTIQNESWRGKIPFILRRTIKGKRWEKVKFRELDIHDHKFIDCQFLNCVFEHCRIGNDVTFENCLWEKCSFTGQYSSLGGPAKFNNCQFLNTNFKNGLWVNINFKNCLFSGRFVNVYWEGKWADSGKVRLQFDDCDMSGATFNNVTIKNGLNLSSIVLPSTGIRLFKNNHNTFASALLEAAKILNKEVSISLSVMAEFAIGQDPVLYDYNLLDHHPGFIGSDARDAFEKVATEFEITST